MPVRSCSPPEQLLFGGDALPISRLSQPAGHSLEVKQEIMEKTLLTVRDRKGYPVDAETLVDAQGNDVTDPNTGQPLIVPRNFDINELVEAGRSIAGLPRPIQNAYMIDWFV